MKKLFSFSLIFALILVSLQIPVQAEESADEIISSMVRVEAREDFAFRSNLSNNDVGESSPITKEYYLSKYKVTNRQYKQFVDATGHKAPSYWKNGTYPAGKADHPVLNVSYSSAVAYCDWLSAKYEDWHFRLPTEAEWENAAMGSYYGNTSVKYPSNVSPSYNSASCTMTTDFNFNGVIASKLFQDYGSDYVVNYIKGDYAGESETLGECIQISKTGGVTNWANHGGSATKGYFLQTDLYATINADGGYTTPVGTYPANTLGLYDMAGNCWDLTSSTIVAVNGLEAGVSCYAVRGGSWYATARSCTFHYRGEGRKDSPSATVGFRLAADYTPSDVNTPDPDVIYATDDLQGALDSAEAGQTVVLTQDITAHAITVWDGITLDLNGNNLTTNYLVCFGTIVDGDVGGYALVKATKGIHIAGQDSFLPIYDTAADGYRLYQYSVENLGFKAIPENPNAVKMGFQLLLANDAGYKVLATTSDTSLDFILYISWNGSAAPMKFAFRDDTIRNYGSLVATDIDATGSSKKAITLTLTGINNLSADAQITVTPEIETPIGLTCKGNSATWSQQ